MPRPRKLVPMQEIIVFQQHQKGISVTEIAYTFKISASTVQRIVRKFKKDQQ
ncbi:helix-turn-helix domain-containing protein [Acetobacterium sp.]|uniref:helix-turn-helix domain-containing protein n=1 Tax=Acetobacterium sp. TaxID=1872094 RepID=UPI002F3E94F4